MQPVAEEIEDLVDLLVITEFPIEGFCLERLFPGVFHSINKDILYLNVSQIDGKSP